MRRKLKVNGRSVQVYESGPWPSPDGVVVLLPGAGDTAESWSLIRDALSGSRRMLSYDRPGMGYSEPSSSADLTSVVDELDAVLSAAGDRHSCRARGALFWWPHRPGVHGIPSGTGCRLVLIDATPPAIADDPGVRAGFLISAVLATILKLLAPFGVTRALLAAGAMPQRATVDASAAVIGHADFRDPLGSTRPHYFNDSDAVLFD